MPTTSTKQNISNKTPRPPVVVVMGHIDHGKSTLLDYIRKTNIVDKEVGGITQRMSAYEVVHKSGDASSSAKGDTNAQNADEKSITFLDTPGHESFNAIRARGANAADIAILVVSAEDGVKPQTLDAMRAIKASALPYIVGISKIDKPNANIERTKQTLAENEIYVEGYGGTIPFVPFSGKTGEGVDDLLDIILLTAEVDELSADKNAPAECLVVEANNDKTRGISATVIVKDGTLRTGTYIVAGDAISPIRIMESFNGKPIKEAGPSKPVRIVGWSKQPEVGGICFTFANKKDAEKYIEEEKEKTPAIKNGASNIGVNSTSNANGVANNPMNSAANSFGQTDEVASSTVPVIIKADTSGSLEAVKYEISKIQIDRVNIRIVSATIGDIMENDIKSSIGIPGTLVIGFTVKTEASAKRFAEQHGVQIQTFDIIYKLTEWLREEVTQRAPKVATEEQKGLAKILKIFSAVKDKQVLGARVEAGAISVNDEVKILRRDVEIAKGRVRELQHMKNKVGSVDEGKEFGALIESKMELAPGDKVEAFHIVVK